MTSHSEQFERCPFCGGPAEIICWEQEPSWYIKSIVCGAHGMESSYKQDAIDSWNKRDLRGQLPCGAERPNRKILCQGGKRHEGSHHATIYWEDTSSGDT